MGVQLKRVICGGIIGGISVYGTHCFYLFLLLLFYFFYRELRFGPSTPKILKLM